MPRYKNRLKISSLDVFFTYLDDFSMADMRLVICYKEWTILILYNLYV